MNMDETSVYVDFPSAYTYEECGVKRVTGNNSRTRTNKTISCFYRFSIRYLKIERDNVLKIFLLIIFEFQGMKLPILILIPRANPFPIRHQIIFAFFTKLVPRLTRTSFVT
jgi:hypothetical protein